MFLILFALLLTAGFALVPRSKVQTGIAAGAP